MDVRYIRVSASGSVTFVYLLAAAILTTRLLSARRSRENEMLQSDLPAALPTRRNSQPIEVA